MITSPAPRKITIVVGEPNSGKTHQAYCALLKASTGVYLGPLRLLALELYQRMNADGIQASLVTGEEKIVALGETHQASTVEMVDVERHYECAVIDECQLLMDAQRGHAWTHAIQHVCTDHLYLICSNYARRPVELLAKTRGCEIEVVYKERLSELVIAKEPMKSMNDFQPGDALVAFSRKDVLFFRDKLVGLGHSVATIYGNLNSEVRAAQAATFNDKKADILVGTDALSMGLNLPIRRVVFTTESKFNGKIRERLGIPLTQQIGGRAGRFGIYDKGIVVGLDWKTHRHVQKAMNTVLSDNWEGCYFVSLRAETVTKLASLGQTSIYKVFTQFINDFDNTTCYQPSVTDEQIEKAKLIDQYRLSLEDKFLLCMTPIDLRHPRVSSIFQAWLRVLERGDCVVCPEFYTKPGNEDKLFQAEIFSKILTAYRWLCYRASDRFNQLDQANHQYRELSLHIDQMLSKINTQRQNPFFQEIEKLFDF